MFTQLWSYSTLCLFIITIATIIIAIVRRKKHKVLSHLFIYPIASYLQNHKSLFFRIFNFNSTSKTKLLLDNLSIPIFIIIETVCIYIFFYKISIFSNIVKRNIKCAFVFFLIIFFLSELISKDDFESHRKIYFIQSCFVLYPSFLFIYHLFKGQPMLKLADEPEFWFNAGIFIFFMLTFPLILMIDLFENGSFVYLTDALYNFGYMIIFLFLIKAYLCKQKTLI